LTAVAQVLCFVLTLTLEADIYIIFGEFAKIYNGGHTRERERECVWGGIYIYIYIYILL